MSSLNLLKSEMWIFYDKWRKTGSFCPAFNEKITISLKGWNHILGQSGFKKRNTGDVFRRLSLLPHAKQIIESSHTIQNKKFKGEGKYKRIFYTLEALVNDLERGKLVEKKVRVILIQDNRGNKIFLSVMSKYVQKD